MKEKNNKEEEKKISASNDDLMKAWSPFIVKFIEVMIAIEDLVEKKQEMEMDPCFAHVMKKFLVFKEKFEAEHFENKVIEEREEERFVDNENFNKVVHNFKKECDELGISVKIRRLIDSEDIESQQRFFGDIPSNGKAKTYDA